MQFRYCNYLALTQSINKTNPTSNESNIQYRSKSTPVNGLVVNAANLKLILLKRNVQLKEIQNIRTSLTSHK